LLLRVDLHIAFDKPHVAFVPKPATDGSMRLVAHLPEHSPELEHLYHNRELHTSAVGIDMLYARFAWSVFTLLDAFLECKFDRRLALRATDPISSMREASSLPLLWVFLDCYGKKALAKPEEAQART
jgi:hypothetical protein